MESLAPEAQRRGAAGLGGARLGPPPVGLRGGEIEVALLLGEELPARGRSAGDPLDRVGGVQVVEEVLVGQCPVGPHPVLADQPRLLDLLEGGVVGEQAGEALGPLQPHRAQPAEVVQAHVVDLRAALAGDEVRAQQPADATHQPDRGVADADDAVAEHGAHRLGDDPGGIGEVDGPRRRRELGDGPRDLEGHGDRAQRIGESARADRLLAQQAEAERDPLVDGAGLRPAHAHGAEHEVRAGHGLAQVGGGDQAGEGDGSSLLRQARALLLDDGADGRQALGVDVVQRDLVDGEAGGGGGDRLVDEGDAEPSASQDGELHGSRTSTASPSGRSISMGRGRSVSRAVKRGRRATSRKPEPGNFSWSASR